MRDKEKNFDNDCLDVSYEHFKEKETLDLDEDDLPYYSPEESKPPHY